MDMRTGNACEGACRSARSALEGSPEIEYVRVNTAASAPVALAAHDGALDVANDKQPDVELEQSGSPSRPDSPSALSFPSYYV